MSELPISWDKANLAAIACVEMGQSPPSSTYNTRGEGLPFFQGKAEFGALYPQVRKWCSVPGKVAHEGDILLSVRAPVGPTNLAPEKSCIGRGLAAIRACPEIHQKYLLHFIRHLEPWLSEQGTGTTFRSIGGDFVRRLQVPLAPFPEQVRIADKLDAVLARADACRERLGRVPLILKRFREAVLEAAVSGRLTEEWRELASVSRSGREVAQDLNARFGADTRGRRSKTATSPADVIREIPDAWGWSTGEEIVETGTEIVYGIVQPGPKLSEGVRYVRGMDIENGRILVDQLMKTSEAIAKRYERASLRGGDVLLGIIRATKVAVVPEELTGANITQGTARFRPSKAIRTTYLARALEAPKTQKWLHDHYRGIDMPGLNLADVRRVPIPIPSLEEQDEIIRRTDELLELSESLSRHHRLVATRVEKLTPSVLAEAFRGELVPQDQNDEPASVLLERVRREKEAASELPKTRSRKAKVKSKKSERRGRAA